MKRIASFVLCALFASVATASAQTAGAQTARRTTQGFNVVLLLGDTQGGAMPEGLSEGARKALADMKDFLPYKGYAMLDNQWIAGGENSTITSRLRGVNGQSLDMQMMPFTRPNGLDVKFHLGDGSDRNAILQARAQDVAMEIANARDRMRELELQLTNLRERYGENHPTVQKAKQDLVVHRMAQLETTRHNTELDSERAHGTGRSIIDTTFSMAVGETVVVGTSRVQGDKALIVLLTAVPKGNPRRDE